MNNHSHRWILAAILLFFGFVVELPVVAVPVPAFDPQKLFASSTHVAVVEVAAHKLLPASPESELDVYVVRRILGEDLPDRPTLRLTQSLHPFAGSAAWKQGETLLAFLQRADGGTWRLADPFYGLFLVSRERAAPGPAKDVRTAVLAELRHSLEAGDDEVIAAAFRALTAWRDTGALKQAKVLTQSARADIAFRALVYRMKVGDPGVTLGDITRLLQLEDLTSNQKDELAWSLMERQEQLPLADLNELLRDPSTYLTLRRVAATILSQKGDRTSLPALAAGLEAKDREIQYRSIVGLSRITGRPGPGYNEFMSDPEPELKEWKTLLKDHQES